MITVTDTAVKELKKYTEKKGNNSFEIVFNGYG